MMVEAFARLLPTVSDLILRILPVLHDGINTTCYTTPTTSTSSRIGYHFVDFEVSNIDLRGSRPIPLVRKVLVGGLSAKGVIELKESIESANPWIIILCSYHTWDAAMPFLARPCSPNEFAFNVNLRPG